MPGMLFRFEAFKFSNKGLDAAPELTMTIIAGFRCHDGIVICADTQETVPGFSKRNLNKVKVEPWYMKSEAHLFGKSVGLSICGAGDSALIQHLTTGVAKSIGELQSVDEACDQIEATIKNVYREFGSIFQVGQLPSVELIYGVEYNQTSRLFHASGPVVNEVDEYCAGGSGYYMADYLHARMYSQGASVHQCVILAAYILLQAREHVDGCGGDSHIAVLRHEGESGLVSRSRVEAITKLLGSVDRQLGEVLLAAADLRTTVDISEKLKNAAEIIQLYRESASDELKNDFAEFLMLTGDETKDDLGFSIRDSQTRESDEDELV